MGKTSPSHVWKEPIKAIGNGWIKLVAKITDPGGGGLLATSGLELAAAASELTLYTTAQPDWVHDISLAEDAVNLDVYALIKKKGAEILHNQKLAGAYSIGDPVYKTAAGTWTIAAGNVATSLLHELGIVCGPADRVTATVVSNMDTVFTTTEPVDICV